MENNNEPMKTNDKMNAVLSRAHEQIREINESLQIFKTLITQSERGMNIMSFLPYNDDDDTSDQQYIFKCIQNMREDMETLTEWRKKIQDSVYILETTLHPDVTSDDKQSNINGSPELKELEELVEFKPKCKTSY